MRRMLLTVLSYVAVLVMGVVVGLRTWKSTTTIAETPAPEIRQQDGSLVLERRPRTLSEVPKVVKLPAIPKNTVVERVVTVDVQPTPSDGVPGGIPTPSSPVSVTMTVVREKDGTRRVIASSPNGTVVGGIDIPIAPNDAPRKELRNAAGVSFNPQSKTYGLWIERDYGRARVGAEVRQERHLSSAGVAVSIRVGIRF